MRELRAREVEDQREIVILADRETSPLDEKGITFIRGNPSSGDDLNRAGLEHVSTVIVLADESNISNAPDDVDARSLLTTLAVETINHERLLVRRGDQVGEPPPLRAHPRRRAGRQRRAHRRAARGVGPHARALRRDRRPAHPPRGPGALPRPPAARAGEPERPPRARARSRTTTTRCSSACSSTASCMVNPPNDTVLAGRRRAARRPRASARAVTAGDHRSPARPARTASATPTRPARVAVIGAGMAGLVAASELLRAGHDPIVLEGQQRVGGRVLTLREPFAPGLWAEAGAMRIPRSHHLTHALIDRFGLADPSVHHGQPRGVLLLRRPTTASPRAGRRPRVLGFETTPAERMPPAQLWAAALEPFVRRLADVGDDAWVGHHRRVRPVLRARVPRPVRLVGGCDRDVRPPVQPGGTHELVVPGAAARGARRLLHRPRLHRRRHRPAPGRVPARARAAPALRRQDGGDRPVRRHGVRPLPQRRQPVHGGSRLRGDDGTVPGAAPRRGAHPVLTCEAARHPPAPLRRVGQGVPAVPAPVLGDRRRHR